MISSKFTSPISYEHPKFKCSLDRIEFIELEEDEEASITSVSDNSSKPRFNITGANQIFAINDLVKIEALEGQDDRYNGQFVVGGISSTYIELIGGPAYNGSITGKVTRLQQVLTTSENNFLMSFIKATDVTDISDNTGFYFNQSFISVFSLGFFNLLRLGHNIESKYTQGLSFGIIDDRLFFQKTLIETFWSQFQRILNDPVKLIGRGYLPVPVYKRLDFLQPVYIKTLETSNLYYINRIGGYEDQSTACDIELIKLP